MENSISVRFYLNKYRLQGSKLPIYLRITLNREKAEIATPYFIEPKDWNEALRRTKKNNLINNDLASKEQQIFDIAKQLEKDKKPLSANSIKNHLTGKDKRNTHLVESFDRYIERLKSAGEVKDETVLLFGVTKRHIEKFLLEKRLKDIRVENIDYTFISDFDTYLLKQKVFNGENTMQRNTANKHHSRVRTILIRAIREGHIHKNPYIDFKLKKIPSNRTYLTDDELKQIKEHDLGGNLSLMKVRDIFIFSVYTGLRFEDAQSLTTENIIKEKNEKYILRIKQEKTDEILSIPLLKPALDIINKYDNSGERITQGKVLPSFSNQKVNSYLKVIADLTGIKKSLTHHVARHTCATTVLLSNDIPIEAVSKWLGHTNIKTTQIYAKITNQYLQNMANKLEEKLAAI
jgi:integrase